MMARIENGDSTKLLDLDAIYGHNVYCVAY